MLRRFRSERARDGFGTNAHVAQPVERVLGKDEVISSILIMGSSSKDPPTGMSALQPTGMSALQKMADTAKARDII
jgi:hypothetical protein